MTDQTTEVHEANRELLRPLRAALYDFEPDRVRGALDETLTADAAVKLAHPFEDLDGPGGWFEEALAPLHRAFPDLERREFIVMAGDAADDRDAYDLEVPGAAGVVSELVGCGGYYTGTFTEPFLGIPPTRRPASFRFHEFFRIVDGRVVEVQGLWDLPELMMQAGVWPMGPSLGRVWQVPGPATQDGLRSGPRDPERSASSVRHVADMLANMGRHPAEPPEAMQLPRFWHPRFSWYGPAGIGTSRGIDGFRRHHQIPFLNAMPDRTGYHDGPSWLFGDGDYVGVTGWPNMAMTVSGDGWLGIAPAGTSITMRSLDFWRIEDGLIRENWVLVDLLHGWQQLGVDVLARMAELAG
ncbi:MAG: ester cyclase [Actinomycetota bacterium]